MPPMLIKSDKPITGVDPALVSKRMDAVIGILQKVRQEGYDVHLHIVGAIEDSSYGKRMKELIGKHRDWVFTEGQLFGQKKKDLRL